MQGGGEAGPSAPEERTMLLRAAHEFLDSLERSGREEILVHARALLDALAATAA